MILLQIGLIITQLILLYQSVVKDVKGLTLPMVLIAILSIVL